MRTHFDPKAISQHLGAALGSVFVLTLISFASIASQPSSNSCNALVSTSNNLYLIGSNGKVLTQFTSDSGPKNEATTSPSGDKVAFLAAQADTNTYVFQVVDRYGRQGMFSVQNTVNRPHRNDDTYGLAENNPIDDLTWNSDDVIRVTKFGGKDESRFEFYRIPNDLSPPAHTATDPILGQNCILKHSGGIVACIEREGTVLLSGGTLDGQRVFSVSGFEGISPEESFTLGIGESATTKGTDLGYTVTLEKVDKDLITLRITPPNGIWEQPTISNGDYAVNLPVTGYSMYGFFASIVNPESNLVQINVVKSDSGNYVFDPALTWLPHGHGLLLIRRTNTQALLYLIQPGQEHGHEDGDEPGKQDQQWHLAAQAPISVPGVIQDMRFATPSLLLLQTADGKFSEMSIDIQHGRHESEDQPTLMLGPITPLPSTLSVTLNGAGVQGKVLGWSCATARHDDDGNDD